MAASPLRPGERGGFKPFHMEMKGFGHGPPVISLSSGRHTQSSGATVSEPASNPVARAVILTVEAADPAGRLATLMKAVQTPW